MDGAGDGQAHHGPHGDIQEGHGKDNGDNQLGPLPLQLFFFLGAGVLRGGFLLYFPGLIAQGVDLFLDVMQTDLAGVIGNRGLLRRQVDSDTADARLFGEYLLYPCGAGGAGHARNTQGDLLVLFKFLEGVADLRHRVHNLLAGDGILIKLNGQLLAGQVDSGAVDAVFSGQYLLNPRGAGRAGHVFYGVHLLFHHILQKDLSGEEFVSASAYGNTAKSTSTHYLVVYYLLSK